MNARVVALGSIVLALGCTRSFSQLAAGNQPQGTACTSAGQCASGTCADGVCCEHPCAASQSCNVAGHVGACSDRLLGSSCAAPAECPSGFCVDGVCCDSACTGACSVCGEAGHCGAAPDDTDPNQQCPTCQACFSGACGPVSPGENPNASCSGELRCNATGACGGVDGGGCQSDLDCAVGACLNGACLQSEVEPVLLDPPMNLSANFREVLAVAANPYGDEAVVFREAVVDANGQADAAEVYLLIRSPGAPWTATDLGLGAAVNPSELATAGLVFDGRVAIAMFQARSSEPTCTPLGVACGIVELEADNHGRLLSGSRLDPMTDDVPQLLDGAVDASGRPFLVEVGTSAGNRFSVFGRDGQGGWSQTSGGALPASYSNEYALLANGAGGAFLVYPMLPTGADPLTLFNLADGSTIVVPDSQLPCTGPELIAADRSGGDGAPLRFSTFCEFNTPTTELVEVDPSTGQAQAHPLDPAIDTWAPAGNWAAFTAQPDSVRFSVGVSWDSSGSWPLHTNYSVGYPRRTPFVMVASGRDGLPVFAFTAKQQGADDELYVGHVHR